MSHSDPPVSGVRPARTIVDAIQFGTTTPGELSVPARNTGTVILLTPLLGCGVGEQTSLAHMLNDQGLATLTVALVTRNSHPVDRTTLPALAQRLADIAEWAPSEPQLAGRPCGCLAAASEAAVALMAAAHRPRCLDALVIVAGRTDLIEPQLALVEAPTLLVEGGSDEADLQRARTALGILPGDADLTIVAGLDEAAVAESACRQVADVAGQWFRQHFAAAIDSPTWQIDHEVAVDSRP
jgi:putative phosphoribosyl transferase